MSLAYGPGYQGGYIIRGRARYATNWARASFGIIQRHTRGNYPVGTTDGGVSLTLRDPSETVLRTGTPCYQTHQLTLGISNARDARADHGYKRTTTRRERRALRESTPPLGPHQKSGAPHSWSDVAAQKTPCGTHPRRTACAHHQLQGTNYRHYEAKLHQTLWDRLTQHVEDPPEGDTTKKRETEDRQGHQLAPNSSDADKYSRIPGQHNISEPGRTKSHRENRQSQNNEGDDH